MRLAPNNVIPFHSIPFLYIHINTHASFNIPRVADPPEDSMRYKNSSVKPWLDRNGRVIWPYSRIAMAKIVRSQSFETFMGIVIMLNILWLDFLPKFGVAKKLIVKNMDDMHIYSSVPDGHPGFQGRYP